MVWAGCTPTMQGVERIKTQRFGGMREMRVNKTSIGTFLKSFSAGNHVSIFWNGQKSNTKDQKVAS